MNCDIEYFNRLIKDSSSYFAHLPKEAESSRQPELLSEHSALVCSYSKIIIQKHTLEGIIKNLIQSAIPDGMNKVTLQQIIDDLFLKSIAYHDLGKVNKRFQVSRMKNNSKMLLEVSHAFDKQHSIIGMYIYLADYFANMQEVELTDEEWVFISNVALYLSYSIYRHHAPCVTECQNDKLWNDENLFALVPYLSLFNIALNDEQIEQFHRCFLENANFNFLFDRYDDVMSENNGFPLFALCKLNYSLLTASDYLATAHYMNNWDKMFDDYGLIDCDLRKKIIEQAEHSKTYNQSVYKSIATNQIPSLHQFIAPSNTNLNELRKCIAIEAILSSRANADKFLFYLEAPTGGGKTNVSMLTLAELLRADVEHKINMVFYVFPFTTLITQTYQSLCDTLGLDNRQIAEIHSKAAFQTGKYEDDYLNYLNNMFVNYPVSLLSHVHFFDVLKTNDKETNYLLHRMANSVVIIDEIQSYSPNTWDKIIYFVSNYARYFNMKFIIMSATLPKIGDLLNNKNLSNDFVYLVKDKSQYFQNPNFCNRVDFDYSLLDNPRPDKNFKKDYLLGLKNYVFEKSQGYACSNNLYPKSVHVIIEFIFKKTASEFYSLLKENNDFFDMIFLLSGTMLEPRRKEIINKLKSSELRGKKVLLVSTQVVEAGVDIDMDIGFKDKSIVDSEEQLAGRINRNVNKSKCTLYIFNCDTEKTIYGRDYRYQFAKEMKQEDYKEILDKKDFDKLYSLIINKINKTNQSVFIENIHDLEKFILTLNYKEVDKQLELIKSLNDSVFVPIEIPVCYFKKESISLLEELNLPHNDTVCGKDVWNVYEGIIRNQEMDFVNAKIQMKKLQGLMSCFTFSIFRGGKDYDLLKTYGIEQYGFLYLESYSDIYSFDDGINTGSFENPCFI